MRQAQMVQYFLSIITEGVIHPAILLYYILEDIAKKEGRIALDDALHFRVFYYLINHLFYEIIRI